jgi:Domain of unknown function (DUF4878)
MAAAQQGDVEEMVSLWARKAIQEQGENQMRKASQGFAETNRQAQASGEKLEVTNVRETIQGDRARVFFFYRDKKGTDSTAMGFALVRENDKWKIYRGLDRSDEDKPFESSFAEKSAPGPSTSGSSPTMTVTPPTAAPSGR